MNSLTFLVALAVACTAVPSRDRKQSRGYFDRDVDYAIVISPNEDPGIHPSWWKPKPNLKPRPKGPFDYPEPYGSSEEEPDSSRYRPVRPGYGGGGNRGPFWWGPTTERPYSNPNPNPFLAVCLRSCPIRQEDDPVCGTNNVTYPNPSRLACEQNCGIAVGIKYPGPCTSSGQMMIEKPTRDPQLCMRSCPIAMDYAPVCGSDNITYTSLEQLECAQKCGIAVTLTKLSACSVAEKPVTSTTENTYYIIATCMRSCPVTGEFNPVCGTNNVTYSNPGRLECAQNCGIEVQIARNTACDAPLTEDEKKNIITTTTIQDIVVTSTSKPYINSNGGDESNTNSSEENNNNHSTVDNGRNEEGNFSYNGTGSEEDNNFSNENSNNSEEESSSENVTEGKNRPIRNKGNNCNGMKRKPPSVVEVMECMQTCTLTSESNPICGTDSITYMNPGRLLCAQFCGVDVKVKKFAPCNSSSITNVHCLTPCTNPLSTPKPDPTSTIEGCMEACSASAEYKPVCGSDNITYTNLEKLQCARRCGIEVTLTRNTYCSAPEVKPNPTSTVQNCIEQCYIPHKLEPICGSDNVTYNNTGHLICARQCGLEVEVKTFAPCENNIDNVPTTSTTTSSSSSSTTTTTTTTTRKPSVVTPGSNGLNFTIDPAILASIWGEVPQTTPKENNDDEDFELDQRFQD